MKNPFKKPRFDWLKPSKKSNDTPTKDAPEKGNSHKKGIKAASANKAGSKTPNRASSDAPARPSQSIKASQPTGNATGNVKKFQDLKLIDPIQKSLKDVGYDTPTPIQAQAIPLILEGHDLLGIAQTGTGKTAAFCLPILHILQEKKLKATPRCPRVLVLTPTRELAIQIHENLSLYGKHLPHKYAVIYGGVGQHKQVQSLRYGTDVLVATPGRLLDLCEQGLLTLSKIEIFVLDEADRMLDMGFMNDIKRIIPMLPSRRHNLFFSATMPPSIQTLANKILNNPKKIEVTPPSTTVERIRQEVMFVEKQDKLSLLVHLLENKDLKRTLVFVGMKHVANRVSEKLDKAGIPSAAIHGNKAQGARQRAIEDFSKGKVKVLVATDIASRGIDIDDISHVINYDLGNLAESYVHRIGRTARAGTDGVAISLVTGEEKPFLANIERTTKQNITVVTDQPFHSEAAASASSVGSGPPRQGGGGGNRSGSRPPRGRSSRGRPSGGGERKRGSSGSAGGRPRSKSRSKT